MTDKERIKLIKLKDHYESKRNEASDFKNNLLNRGIDSGIVFERAKTREKNYHYMIRNINIILDNSDGEFY